MGTPILSDTRELGLGRTRRPVPPPVCGGDHRLPWDGMHVLGEVAMSLGGRTRRVASMAVAALAALVLSAPLALAGDAPRAEALSGSQFDPGYIIDDALFYDGNAMSAADIQAFLDSKIGSCLNGQCLNVYTIDYGGRARDVSANGNLICEAIPAGRYSAARLIFTAQQACGISAKVVLVTMQKEQSLVTARQPSLYALSHAMGYACPDTAPCNPNAAGVGNQIVLGTRQLKAYNHSQGSAPGTLFGRPVGSQYIAYHPNSGCGGTIVNVQNLATAALYTYTPYQPNGAALANLTGAGDSCSSYGNRNFWVFYNNWFGAPTNPAPERIAAAYAAAGGAGGWLGAATSSYVCGLRNGGCYREFANGAIYASFTTQGAAISGPERARWAALRAQDGVLGYPTTSRIDGLIRGGSYQVFEFGAMYTSPSGTWPVRGGIKDAWNRQNSEWGALGYPASDEIGVAGAVYQQFENGRIYWTAAGGARVVPAASVAALAAHTWLGIPMSDHICGLRDGGCYQVFQGGVLYTTGNGVWPIRGGVKDAWVALGSEWGKAGYPRSAEIGIQGGTFQDFDNGRIYWSASTGARYVPATSVPVVSGFGWLGFPTTNQLCGLVRNGCYQVFQGGAVYTSAGGTWPVRGGIKDAWVALGSEWGEVGYPLSGEIAISGGAYQEFENGRIYWSPSTGARSVPTASVAALGSFAWLGYPTTNQMCGLVRSGCYQLFQSGVLYTSAGGTWPVRGGIKDAWVALGSEWGKAGYPLSGEIPDGAGVYQQFENGRITWTAAEGARYVPAGG